MSYITPARIIVATAALTGGAVYGATNASKETPEATFLKMAGVGGAVTAGAGLTTARDALAASNGPLTGSKLLASAKPGLMIGSIFAAGLLLAAVGANTIAHTAKAA